jgi:hypothetical protein
LFLGDEFSQFGEKRRVQKECWDFFAGEKCGFCFWGMNFHNLGKKEGAKGMLGFFWGGKVGPSHHIMRKKKNPKITIFRECVSTICHLIAVILNFFTSMPPTSCQIWLSPLVHRWPTHLLHKLEKQKKTLIGTKYTNLVHF